MGAQRDNASIVEWRELCVWALCALDRTDQARPVAEEALARAQEWGAPRALGFALLTRARVEHGEARLPWLREAADRLAEADSLYRLAMARLQLAAALLETGRPADHEEAAPLARLALEYGRVHEVAPMARSASRLLARAGEPVDDLSAHPAGRLTPSERKVAELAAAGDTNRQIAEKLFVTVKAVEWHLSNTYRKLGISSRTALAEALYGDPGASSSSLM
jgi:DNA-binding NarL/FixJ family response regulator